MIKVLNKYFIMRACGIIIIIRLILAGRSQVPKLRVAAIIKKTLFFILHLNLKLINAAIITRFIVIRFRVVFVK